MELLVEYGTLFFGKGTEETVVVVLLLPACSWETDEIVAFEVVTVVVVLLLLEHSGDSEQGVVLSVLTGSLVVANFTVTGRLK